MFSLIPPDARDRENPIIMTQENNKTLINEYFLILNSFFEKAGARRVIDSFAGDLSFESPLYSPSLFLTTPNYLNFITNMKILSTLSNPRFSPKTI